MSENNELADYTVAGGGMATIYTITPNNEKSKNWLDEMTDGQWLGNSLCVEHRYIWDLIDRLVDDGFTVST